MGTNPFLNALSAALYIGAVASIMHYGSKLVDPVDTILAPIAFLSLFVFSALVMGYLLLLMPVRLYIDGQRQESLKLLTRTILYFGAVTATFFLAILAISTL